MLENFQSYIEQENLFSVNDKIVLAVSGGADSMVMLRLFEQSDYNFVVAHCNFYLRGIESDSEEIFLRDYCGEHGIELYVKHFDTREYADLEGISIEMAARELRYNWFRELRIELSFNYTATAHHQDDLIETMLINLSRGTGIRGLTGIQPKNGQVVRPMLFATREEILDFATKKKVDYKHDSSNDELIYQRNIIRHKIIPQFEEINPAFRRNAANTAHILSQTEKIYQRKLDEIRQRLEEKKDQTIRFSISKLKEEPQIVGVLFELLHLFGFNSSQAQEIADALDAEPGKSFFSSEYRLVKDREFLIVTPLTELNQSLFYIEDDCVKVTEPLELQFQIISKSPSFRFSTNPQIADFDFDKLQFPLIIKKWEQGEYFQPLGMAGLKKLSDFFIDEKMSIPEKESIWILYSGKKVVWVIGKRLDDRFKIAKETQTVFRISIGK